MNWPALFTRASSRLVRRRISRKARRTLLGRVKSAWATICPPPISRGGFQECAPVAADEDNGGALARQRAGNREPDAAVRARHGNDFVLQF